MSESTIGIYTVGPKIGKGSFATVYKCINNKTHQSVAIKSVVRSKLKSKKLIENLEIEISILRSMKHPHVVSLQDYTQSPTHFYLVMDYCSMGDLSYFIKKRDQLIQTHPIISSLLQRYPSPQGSHGLNETLVTHFLQQLACALKFLRSKSLVHRDIKPQNLLLCPPSRTKDEFDRSQYVGLWELPVLKIADFGFARFLPSTSMAETLCGSPLYMAPEILRYEKYNAKADLWSVGAVFYEMTVGKPPYRAANHIELLKNIEKSQDKIKFPSLAQVPDALKHLIRSLLKYNPTERISFSEFFNDPLILNELESSSTPLDTSEVDENLFISEYISPIKASDRENYTDSTRQPNEEEKLTNINRTTASSLHGAEGEGVEPTRDEQIMLIMSRNSPDPQETSTRFRQVRQGPEVLGKGEHKVDIILEKDYVVVEKRAVEVNAIADELARVGTSGFGRRRLSASTERDALISRRSSQRSNSSGSQHGPYLGDRKVSVSILPTNALGKAISMASHRLFGNTTLTSPMPGNSNGMILTSREQGLSPLEFENNLLLNKLNLPTPSSLSSDKSSGEEANNEDDKVLKKLESLATKAHAINLFADVKFSQLVPSPPSTNGDQECTPNEDSLPPKVVKNICEEGIVLYVKTLALLAKGMGIANQWWSSTYDTEEAKGEASLGRSINIQTSVKINELVQWIRERFNECLEKAELVKLRLDEALSNIAKWEKQELNSGDSNTQIYVGASASNAPASELRVIFEKLIFDRALEISRNAAVNELVKVDLKGCELAYSTAIWMLEALLDEEGGEDDNLDGEDRLMIEKFILSIGNRLSVLKKKLEYVS